MKISATEIYGLEESIVASGFPMLKSVPSEEDFYNQLDAIHYGVDNTHKKRAISLGSSDMGEGHDNYIQGIIVQFNLEWPIKLWTEAQRYHFFDFVSSMSTMHRLTSFNFDNCFDPYVDERIIPIMKDLQEKYNEDKTSENYLRLIFTAPVGTNLMARMTTNYRQLKTIYNQRKNHRLPHWKQFCEWCLTLDRFKELTGV